MKEQALKWTPRPSGVGSYIFKETKSSFLEGTKVAIVTIEETEDGLVGYSCEELSKQINLKEAKGKWAKLIL